LTGCVGRHSAATVAGAMTTLRTGRTNRAMNGLIDAPDGKCGHFHRAVELAQRQTVASKGAIAGKIT
ncbi:MAG TPA: hypothetical protein VFP00_08255, partial [Burkholderiales bacterium]|nr:hypothetical protein [Burkholderiales bacterium]